MVLEHESLLQKAETGLGKDQLAGYISSTSTLPGHPARVTVIVKAGLLACGSSSRLPPSRPDGQWLVEETNRIQLRGQRRISTGFPLGFSRFFPFYKEKRITSKNLHAHTLPQIRDCCLRRSDASRRMTAVKQIRVNFCKTGEAGSVSDTSGPDSSQ